MKELKEWITYDGTSKTNNKKSYEKDFLKLGDHMAALYGWCAFDNINDISVKIFYVDGDDEYILEIVSKHGKWKVTLYNRKYSTDNVVFSYEVDSYEEVLEVLLSENIIEDTKVCRLDEWVLHGSNNNGSSNNPTSANNLKLWRNFTTKATDFIRARADSNLFTVVNRADQNNSTIRGFLIREDIMSSFDKNVVDDVIVYYIEFDLDSEEFKVQANAGAIPNIEGTGFNNMIDAIITRNLAPFSFRGRKLDLKSLKESYSTIDDFRDYENMWD